LLDSRFQKLNQVKGASLFDKQFKRPILIVNPILDYAVQVK